MDKDINEHVLKCCRELKIGSVVYAGSYLAVIRGLDWNGITYDLLDGTDVGEWCEWRYVQFFPTDHENIKLLFGFEHYNTVFNGSRIHIDRFSLHNVIDGTTDFVIEFALDNGNVPVPYIAQDILPNYTEIPYIHNLQNAYEVICGHQLKLKSYGLT